MKKFFSVILLSLLFFTCDDGDIITVEFDFDDTFEACGEMVLYKIKEDPAESFSVLLTSPRVVSDEPLNIEQFLTYTITSNGIFAEIDHPELTFVINGSSNRFNYRTYNTTPDNFFCEDVPPSGIEILSDDESTDGNVVVATSLVEDDNDGIPSWFEDENLDGDDDPSTNPTDRDGDGIPDYLDDDDDGDNVKTVDENPNFDTSLGNLLDPQDSDDDGAPDYLDLDDDGDGVLTRDEENDTQDQNPLNDRTGQDEDDGVIDNITPLDYLNPNISSIIPATAYRQHTIHQEFIVNVTLYNISLSTISLDEFDFGILDYNGTSKQRYITPDFP